jgi:mannan endo-1,4-beta-mannosidase
MKANLSLFRLLLPGPVSLSVRSPRFRCLMIHLAEISAYIKSIDSNHLVALGDEGFFNQANGPNYPYQGSEGVDFDANLSKNSSFILVSFRRGFSTEISTLDFGTFHSYPIGWGQTSDPAAWGVQWIKGQSEQHGNFRKV